MGVARRGIKEGSPWESLPNEGVPDAALEHPGADQHDPRSIV